MDSLSNSRLYVLQLLRERGPLSVAQISKAAPTNGHRVSIEIGRGATVQDFISVMRSEGVLTGDDQRIELSPLGKDLVGRMASEEVGRAVHETPSL